MKKSSMAGEFDSIGSYSATVTIKLTRYRQILDDTYRHALRIYHDTVSGAIRLQASVHLSEMDR
jgi:hypothetical protein